MCLYTEVPGQGRLITLIHGWGFNSHVWTAVAGKLEPNSQAIAIDQPGYDRNPTVLQEYTLSELASHIAQSLSAPAILIGWSLGGLAAIRIALDFPDRVKGLGLIATNPCFTRNVTWPHGIEPQVFERFAKGLGTDPQVVLRQFAGLVAHGGAEDRRVIRYLRNVLSETPSTNIQALHSGLAILANTDLRPKLAAIEAPVLCLLGGKDSLVPVSLATALPALMPTARIEVLADAAHAPFLSHPEKSTQLLKEFICGI